MRGKLDSARNARCLNRVVPSRFQNQGTRRLERGVPGKQQYRLRHGSSLTGRIVPPKFGWMATRAYSWELVTVTAQPGAAERHFPPFSQPGDFRNASAGGRPYHSVVYGS